MWKNKTILFFQPASVINTIYVDKQNSYPKMNYVMSFQLEVVAYIQSQNMLNDVKHYMSLQILNNTLATCEWHSDNLIRN